MCSFLPIQTWTYTFNTFASLSYYIFSFNILHTCHLKNMYLVCEKWVYVYMCVGVLMHRNQEKLSVPSTTLELFFWVEVIAPRTWGSSFLLEAIDCSKPQWSTCPHPLWSYRLLELQALAEHLMDPGIWTQEELTHNPKSFLLPYPLALFYSSNCMDLFT